ncbi:hypothetical protein LUX33_34470 [Actinomadura madurae]|uniref:hypothetical protein n=1 Tax=Actinomadura madurae TaxID=1993 RepID=UPI0020D25132|nr:hypothetical protein [Actinomadura madurae]MCP9953041.1 hypothetical protein [Actinomadura madurae]
MSEDAAEQGGQDDATAASETPRDETTTEEAADDTAVDDTAVDETAVDSVVDETVVEEAPTPVSAFEKAKEAEDAVPLAPVLVPDAILPPGFVPPTGSGPFPSTEPDAGAAPTAEQPAVITPVYHAEGGVPNDTPPPPGRPPRDTAGQGGNKRRTLLIGGGAAIILAAAAALFLVGGTGASGEGGGKKQSAEPPPVSQSTPPATPSPGAGGGGGAPRDAHRQREDRPRRPGVPRRVPGRDPAARRPDLHPRPLVPQPGRRVRGAGLDARHPETGEVPQDRPRDLHRPAQQARRHLRHRGDADEGGGAHRQQGGRPRQVRVVPRHGGQALPGHRPGRGYAAATVRGRYVAYAYVQWANGRTAEPGDPTIKKIAQQFLDHDLRPIVQRAGG